MFLCQLVHVLALYVVTLLSVNSINVDTMRSKELRKNLLKWGYNLDDLNKILDKKELRVLAKEFYSQKEIHDKDVEYKEKGVKFSIMCVIIGLIFFFWEPLSSFLLSLRSFFDGYIYQIKERIRLISISIKNHFFIATISLISATIIEVIQPLIQLSIALSWVIPTGSMYRRYLFPMPSFSTSINHILGRKDQASSSSDTMSSIG